MMTEIHQDGRVVLCKEQLKSLRRGLGASQEKVAFLCAERGLSVSIASLKRAETSRNVLYRTARDLARFYGVDVAQLSNTGQLSASSAETRSAQSTTPTEHTMAVQRDFVFLCCEQAEVDFSVSEEGAGVESILAHIAPQYNAEFICTNNQCSFYSFGATHTQGNEAKRAIAFGKRCLQIFSSLWGNRQIAKLGLCVGVVTLPENELEFDMSNFNSDIEALMLVATPGEITISEELLFAAGDNCSPIKDESAASSYWTLDDHEQTDKRDYSPVIGRRVEITLFNAVLESTREYQALQLVHLLGNAGIGKSRLTEEFARVATLDGFSCHVTNMMDFQAEQKKLTIPRLLKSLLGIGDSETNLSLDEINSRNELLILQETTHLPLLHSLLNWKISNQWGSLFAAMSPEKLFEYQCQLISRIISMKASVAPLLIVVEDYHWSQNTERAYIESMMEQLVNDSVVLLITTRPGNASESVVLSSEASGAAVTNISLGPLSRVDAQRFAEHISGIDKDYRDKCIAKAQGNPLFLEQLLKDRRGSVRDGLPYSLRSLIVSRIDDMPKSDQRAVRAASVIGYEFPLGLLRNLINLPDYDPAQLISSNIINGSDDSYSFNHALIVNGVYQSISKEDQRKLHDQCAQWYSDDIVMQCQHLLKAKHPDVIEKLIPAIQHLIANYNFERAKEFVQVGLGLSESQPAQLRLNELQADVYARTGNIAEALSAYELMFRNAVSAEDKANALIEMANCLNTLDQFEKAMKTLGEAEEISNESNLLHQLSRVYYLRGNFLFPKGQSQKCIEAQEQALHFARKASVPELEARSLGGLGDAAYASGKMVTAYNYFKQCLTLCNDHDLKAVSAANMFMMGTVRIYLNENHQALTDVEESIATAQLVGHKRAEIVSRLTASWILADSLRVVEAESQIDVAMDIAVDIGAQRFIPFLKECLSRCLWLSGNTDEAFSLAKEALDEVEDLNAQAFIGPWVLGTCALLSATAKEAQEYLDRADVIIENGCVGHNYYRFYMEAIDTAILHGLYNRATQYHEKFRLFTENEPCPWSDFYLKRAELLLSVDDNENRAAEISNHIETAKSIQLLSAIALLESSLKEQRLE